MTTKLVIGYVFKPIMKRYKGLLDRLIQKLGIQKKS